MTITETDIRHMLVKICRETYERHLVVGPGGNISGKLDDGRVLVSPSGGVLVQLSEDDFVWSDMDRKTVAGERPPSSELDKHLAIYRHWPEYRYVLHTHPPTVTGLSCAEFDLSQLLLVEDIPYYIRNIDVIDFIESGTDALTAAVESKVAHANAFILRGHGLLVAGRTASEALFCSELIEECAKMYVAASSVGKFPIITPEQIRVIQNEPDNVVYDDSKLWMPGG